MKGALRIDPRVMRLVRLGATLVALSSALLAGCGRSHEPGVDSTTNWLQFCRTKSDCGELDCICNACHQPCTIDSACGELAAGATCSGDPSTSLCNAETVPVCELRCGSDEECRDGLTCEGGSCASLEANTVGVRSFDDAGPARDTDATAPDYGFDFVQIAVGGRHTCGLRDDGSLLCWGSNTYGQQDGVGLGTAADLTQVTAGGYHTCGVRRDGSLVCWGGWPEGVDQVTGPNAETRVDFTQVAAGDQHTCALHADRSVHCWGLDNYGQVTGPNSDTEQGFTQVAGGYEHTCAVRTDGSLACWGRDLAGEVSGPNGDVGRDYMQVATGAQHTCALRTTGALRCWGTDERADEVSGPNEDPGTNYKQVMAAAYQTCALDSEGALTCWGSDEDGQVSGPNRVNAVGYVQLSGSIEVDGNFLCALMGDGTVSCWGNDDKGQISGQDVLARQPH